MTKPNLDPKKYEERADGQGFIHRNLDEVDEAINVATDGPIDDTISSRMLRWKDNTVPEPNKLKHLFGRFMCWWLGSIQTDHDILANIGDHERAEDEIKRTTKVLKVEGINIQDKDNK